MERKLKRKIAKSVTPGDLGALSVSVTIFGANLLRDALRRESTAALKVPPSVLQGLGADSGLGGDGGGGGGGGGGGSAVVVSDGDLAAAVAKWVDARDAIVLQAQEELQQAFLSHRHPGGGTSGTRSTGGGGGDGGDVPK